MDFLRMEGESNLLALLPSARRAALADAWYKRVSPEVRQTVRTELTSFQGEPRLRYRTKTPENELFEALQGRLRKVTSQRYTLGADAVGGELKALDGLTGESASALPELSFLQVDHPDGTTQYFTLLRESAHYNVAQLFNEDDRRTPEQDQLCIVPGFLGAYPNQLFRVARADLSEFIQQVKGLDPNSYSALRRRFGISRVSSGFWPTSDAMHEAYRRLQPLEAGLFDFNRLAP
jgi:hypothetical protein